MRHRLQHPFLDSRVFEKLNGVRVAGVLGNHGAESGKTSKARQDAKLWKTALEHERDPFPGTLRGILRAQEEIDVLLELLMQLREDSRSRKTASNSSRSVS